MKTYKRSLTSAQSTSCACALHKRCTCRCNGLLHGVSHSQYQQLEANYLSDQGYITEAQVADIIAFLKEE
jgi:hypothetical protein